MRWKRATLVIIIILLLFMVVSDWTSCKGSCGSSQIHNSQQIFTFILAFTAILIYFSLSLWGNYKDKYISKK
jgi:hypothetical protein